MKIHVMSDLHLEFGKFPRNYTPPECDVVILSGDIGPGVQGIEWAGETFTKPVIYVAGNHEYYNRVMPEHLLKMRHKATSYPNVHFLNNDIFVIDGVAFIGATLWTDFDLFGDQCKDMAVAARGMTDYRLIAMTDWPDRRMITPDDLFNEYLISRTAIRTALETSNCPIVVVTHHAPSLRSVPERFKAAALSAAFASRLDHMIMGLKPKLWTHGHTHDSFDYNIGETRVVCNPRGYVGYDLNREFDPALVIEV